MDMKGPKVIDNNAADTPTVDEDSINSVAVESFTDSSSPHRGKHEAITLG
jgi:hypothetical protein